MIENENQSDFTKRKDNAMKIREKKLFSESLNSNHFILFFFNQNI